MLKSNLQKEFYTPQKAAEGGFKFNDAADNGTALPKSFHKWSKDWHVPYNKAIGDDLDKLWDPKLSPEKAAELMRRYSETLRYMLNAACK